MQTDSIRSLHILKQILLTDDREKVSQLEAELANLKLSIEDKEKLITTLEPVIADLLTKKIRDSKDEMADALAPVMGSAIKRQIQDAKETIIDALYPVIGKTIRKAVSEAMKNLAKTVNEKIDNAFSFRIFRKKVRARISGLSTAELLLNESLPFTIRDIFYIHKDTGILLAHTSSGVQSTQQQKELLSGMLTAITNFSKSAFKSETERDLNVIEYDDLHIYLENGRHAYLAVVTSGIADDGFYKAIHILENQCHKKYAAKFHNFNGDVSVFSDADDTFAKTILTFNTAEPKEIKQNKSARYAFYFLLLLLLTWAVVSFIPETKQPSISNTVNNKVMLDENGLKEILSNKNIPELSAALNNVHFIIHDNIIFLEGFAPSEIAALKIAKAVAQICGKSVIVDHLDYTSDLQNFVKYIHVYFAKNSTTIDSAYTDILIQLADRLKSSAFGMLRIKGYSDNTGAPAINLRISQERAANIKAFLVFKGIEPAKIKITGFGSGTAEPVNTSKQEQALKRYVCFEVY